MMKHCIGALLVALCLAGCEGLVVKQDKTDPARTVKAETEPKAATPTTRNELEELLQYWERVRKLPATEMARELEVVRAAYVKDRNDQRRIQLAMLYMQPGSRSKELEKANMLLDLAQREGKQDDVRRPLIGLLAVLASEMKRLEDNAEQAAAKVKEEQRKAETAQERAEQQALRANDLQTKLEALKTLELQLRKAGRKS
ncbi:hypothetical protein HNQ59_001488 [Chitinivorax tropicus]|uniref:Uncharacterized protein n=1 Tax=Chitinivorax tropicus TaxID=714531 RepID=A0A840MPU7_9PROT|nr:hypothetical protein [Chitinivorax tropicus]MBB5018203.1 hypothetical protein [Chitinivorax tropicus]